MVFCEAYEIVHVNRKHEELNDVSGNVANI